jgi:ClpP class serine protease
VPVSAGGAPAQCELISNYIRRKAAKHNIPVLAFANDVAASGGYWLMCAADELYACRTSLVGSIGVVGNSFGFVDVLKKLGVERRIAVAGNHEH